MYCLNQRALTVGGVSTTVRLCLQYDLFGFNTFSKYKKQHIYLFG